MCSQTLGIKHTPGHIARKYKCIYFYKDKLYKNRYNNVCKSCSVQVCAKQAKGMFPGLYLHFVHHFKSIFCQMHEV